MSEPSVQSPPELDWFEFERGDVWLDLFRQADLPGSLGAIGPYALISELGRGGQGVVYRARQPGMNRDIALKRLQAGIGASERARRRFEREIETAAALSHPHIAAAFAADVIDGVPLFAMELVEGEALTDWARGREQREIVAVLVAVCDAVQYAHARGVIHRDLKPSNILVAGGPDSRPMPKILDFGLARLAADAELTAADQFMGTPAYASPEQRAGRWSDVDARSDVYSLGMILFDALDGGRPEADAPLSFEGMDASLAQIARRALRERPDERYQTVAALGEDLRRYLAGEPVLAQRASTVAILRSLVRRHRVASVAIVSLVITVFASAGGFAALSYALNRERHAMLRALEHEREARRTADRVNEYVRNIFLSADPNLMNGDLRVRDVLDRASAYTDAALASEPASAAGVRHTLGVAYGGLGEYGKAAEQFRRELAYLRPHADGQPRQLVETLRCLGTALFLEGKADDAESFCAEAVDRGRSLSGDDGSSLMSALIDLGRVKAARHDFDSAEQLFQESLRVAERAGRGDSTRAGVAHRELGEALRAKGDLVDGLAELRRAYEIHRSRTADPSSDCASDLEQLGLALLQSGDHAGGLDCLRQSLRMGSQLLGEHHPFTEQVREELESAAGGADAPAPPGQPEHR